MKNSFSKRALSGLFGVCAAILVLGAIYGLRRRCEAFGCPNSTILWFMWALACLATGALGLRLRSGLVPGTASRRVTSIALAVLAVLAVGLAGYWSIADAA